MASPVLTNVTVYLAQFDISGFLNSVKLDYAAKPLNDTRYGHTTEVNKGGAKGVNFAIGGFGDPATAGMEAIAFNRIGTANLPLTVSPLGAAAGDVAYFFHALKASLKTFGNHGELMPYQGTASASGTPLVRGKVFVSAATAKTATGSSSILQLGAVAAGKRVYASLHVLAPVAGSLPTLDVIVQSAALVGFGSPATRLTFTQATAPTSQLLSAAGAITDAFWRVTYTIGGTGSPSFPIVVVVGII